MLVLAIVVLVLAASLDLVVLLVVVDVHLPSLARVVLLVVVDVLHLNPVLALLPDQDLLLARERSATLLIVKTVVIEEDPSLSPDPDLVLPLDLLLDLLFNLPLDLLLAVKEGKVSI